jgi:formylmethanofuran dehydrogenase subunit E
MIQPKKHLLAPKIGSFSFEEYKNYAESFHGYAAPGLILGGFMVDLAQRNLPPGILFDALCETSHCLPDAIQLLTPCTTGNGWLRVIDLGRFALSLYDKEEGSGIRVFLDPEKLGPWPRIKTWLFKLQNKPDQDTEGLLNEIRDAGSAISGMEPVRLQPHFLQKDHRGGITLCPTCGEPYPLRDGTTCQACQGKTPYLHQIPIRTRSAASRPLTAVPLTQAVGKRALHDMTLIIPGMSKGPAFSRGQHITAGDLCRLERMGRQQVYLEEDNGTLVDWVHENEAALAFAKAMAGEGITFSNLPREGRIDLLAERDGLFLVQEDRLQQFNMVEGVMAASRRSGTVAARDQRLAATRAIPLFLKRTDFEKALAPLQDGPLFQILPLKKARVGILVTGSEVYQGLVEDKFIPIIRSKVEHYGCRITQSLIVPDERQAIVQGIRKILETGADLLVTTAGLSVDPDDVTRQGLLDAGADDLLYGAPVIPGAMSLLARIGATRVIGVPACALYFKTTAFDLLLPRVLADLPLTRWDLSKLGHGSLCQDCRPCTYPKCPLGG